MGIIRPMPEGFAADAFTLSSGNLRKKYRCSAQTVMRWRREIDNPPPDRWEPPADRRELAPSHTLRQLCLKYGVGHSRMGTWLKKLGVSAFDAKHSRPWQFRPCPDDFAQVALTMSKTALRRHYGTSDDVIARWILHTGVQPLKVVPVPPSVFRMPHNGSPRVQRLKNYDRYDEAADILRKWFAVYRCDERGRLDEKGIFWRVGNIVVDRDELLARAARKRAA